MYWEIIHLPGKTQISLDESLVDVLAAKIEPKVANDIVRKLNQACPLENLRHVKRVRRRNIEGKLELSVIICPGGKNENHVDGLSDGIDQLINANQLRLFKVKVAKNPASSKEEWEEQCKLWPTSYHPPTNPDGVAGIREEDSQFIFKCMKMTIQSTKLSHLGGKVVNSAVIVDPLSGQVISSSNDETCSWVTSTCKTSSMLVYQDNSRANASHDSEINFVPNNQEVALNWTIRGSVDFDAGVSCLNPWGWMEQGLSSPDSFVKTTSNWSWHPLRHAALSAIEKAAARDRQLFPRSASETQAVAHDSLHNCFDNNPAKRQKLQDLEGNNSDKEVSNDDLPTGIARPYLCTGFDIYLAWEPCTMCAMALVHQRIRRLFFAFPNPNAGALGSVYRLQGEKSLNHHYSVFRIKIPDKALLEMGLNGMVNTLSEG